MGVLSLQAGQQPGNAGSVPFTASNARYPAHVQFVRDGPLGDETCRLKRMNGWSQGLGSHISGVPNRTGSVPTAFAGRGHAQAG